MKIQSLLFLLLLGIFMMACSDDEADDAPIADTCDTSGLSYTNGISAIINSSCATPGCHNSATASTFPMGNYDETFAAVGVGRIIGSINHQSGFLPMPYPLGSAKMDDCNIDKLTQWINDGAPE